MLCGPVSYCLGEILGVFLPGTHEVLYALVLRLDFIAKAGKMNLFTPFFMLMVRKPLV
jgi:hypothetical protein